MMQKNKKGFKKYWSWILLGVVFVFPAVMSIRTGIPMKAPRGDIYAPLWASWFVLSFGLSILFVSIRAWWQSRGKPDPASNLDEEAAKAEAVLDAMYIRDHGRPPEKPKKEDKEVSSN